MLHAQYGHGLILLFDKFILNNNEIKKKRFLKKKFIQQFHIFERC